MVKVAGGQLARRTAIGPNHKHVLESGLEVTGTIGAIAVAQRPDGDLLDVRVWCLMLAVQSVPYAAAGLVSLVSATPWLSGRWIGEMRRMLIRDSA